MDTFFVSVERLLDPKLRAKPVIVGGEPKGRGVVAGCSYEARAFGVHSAMPIRKAYELCPKGIYLSGNYIFYSQMSEQVTNLLTDLVPMMEKSSVDEFYVDLSVCERMKGPVYDWAQQIQRMLKGETNLPISIGLASNKLVAKVATTQVAKRFGRQHHYVPRGGEASFLAPFPIRTMPGIGEKTEHFLREYNLQRIGDLAVAPKEVMGRLLGKTGHALVDKARGIDPTPLMIDREQKSFSREITFSDDTIDVKRLFTILLSLSSDLASDLRKAKRLAKTFTLKLRYTDFETHERTFSADYTNSDQSIYAVTRKLLSSLWTRRVRVRLLGIRATKLIDDIEQDYLFEELGDQSTLNRSFDTIRFKYGDSTIQYAGVTIN